MNEIFTHLWRKQHDHKFLQKALSWLYTWFGHNRWCIKGKANRVSASGAYLRRVTIDIRGEGNKVVVEQGTRLTDCTIYIRGTGHTLHIGRESHFKNSEFWFEDEKGKIHIGQQTTCEGVHVAVTEPESFIQIGDDCMLSHHIDIRCGDSHSIIDLKTERRINYAKPVKIGNHCWIGAHVQILKGVTIGAQSVIGIRSVVTKDLPDHCIAAGIPAVPVKEGVIWKRERI
jgi:acetyltransferase-like isoleucine patch superfamily enzyme